MATSSSSVMKWSLMVVVLLSAVVASQAHQVSCKNTCTNAMLLNGIWTDVGVTTVLEAKDGIVVEVSDGKGMKHVGMFKFPVDVKALEFVHEGGGFVKALITNFSSHVSPGRRTLSGIGSGVAAAAAGMGKGMGNAAKGVGKGMGNAAKVVGKGMGNAAKGAGKGMGNAAKGAGKGLGNAAR